MVQRFFFCLVFSVLIGSVQGGWFGPNEKDVREAVLNGRSSTFFNKYVETDSIYVAKEDHDDLWYVSCIIKDRSTQKRERLTGQVTVGKNKYGKYCLRFVDAETVSVDSSGAQVQTGANLCDFVLKNGAKITGKNEVQSGEGSCDDPLKLKSRLGSFCGYEFGKVYEGLQSVSLQTKLDDFFDRVELHESYAYDGKLVLMGVTAVGSLNGMTADQIQGKYKSVLTVLKLRYDVELVKKGNAYVFSLPDQSIRIRVGPLHRWGFGDDDSQLSVTVRNEFAKRGE